jgi:glycosyltransferase involved in cell wall biosynthesis
MGRGRGGEAFHVIFGPSVPQADVPALLNACDAGVATLAATPLTRGSLPVKVFEQLACALPVVLSGAGECEEILRSAGVGLTVPPGDAAALARALRALADDPAGARAMGEKGRAHVEARYDRRRLADDYLEILAAAIAENSGEKAA